MHNKLTNICCDSNTMHNLMKNESAQKHFTMENGFS